MARTPKITDEQLASELAKGKKIPAIAKEYSMSERNLWARKAKLAKKGVHENNDISHLVPEGFMVERQSILTGPNGEIKLQWTKNSQDKEKMLSAMQAMVDALKEEIPRAEPRPFEVMERDSDLLCQYTITDYHYGMLAWGEETRGANWDTKIAKDLLINWFKNAISMAPNAETAILANIGDFMHWDGLDAVTPTSGHVLDADIRFQRLVRQVINVTRVVIDMLLAKHKKVHVVWAEGNHDMASSIWMREMLVAFYEDEHRVTIDNAPDAYYLYKHGKVFLGYHHSHLSKIKKLPEVMVSKFRKEYGECEHHYVHCGHYHHHVVEEGNLLKVEMHQTLAAKDAYASRGGYMSKRSASVITYHKEYGEVARSTITPQMIGFDGR